MIDRLIRWSLTHRTLVAALSAAFLVWGGWTTMRAPLDVLPDLTAPSVTILAEAPGMDPLEIESLVTFPIDSALNGAAGVRRVRSATAVGGAVVWVEFDWGQDINRARQTVTEKLSLVSGSLPVTPVMAPSLTDQSLGLPSQPVRSWPLNSDLNPGSAADAVILRATARRGAKARAERISDFFCIALKCESSDASPPKDIRI